MSKKMFTLVSSCIGGIASISSAFVTYFQPTNATLIVASIGIGSTAIIEICNLFTKVE